MEMRNKRLFILIRDKTNMSKLRLIIFLLCLSVCKYSNAQTIIPKVGITYSKTSRSDADTEYHYKEVNFRQGFMAGVALQISPEDGFFFQPELLYIQKGYEVSEKAREGVSSVAKYYLHRDNCLLEYLEIPLLIMKEIKVGKRIKFYPQFGMNISYGLGGKLHYYLFIEDYSGQITEVSYTAKVKFTEYQNGHPNDLYLKTPIDFGFLGGVSILLFDKIFFEIRYNLGLRKFEFYSYDEEDAYNKCFQFSVGVPIATNFFKNK